MITMLALTLLILSGSDRCAKAEITLSNGVTVAGAGLGIFTKVTNCGNRQCSFTVTVSVADACGSTSIVLDSDPADGKLSPDFAFVQAASYLVPNCVGTYTVTAVVGSNNGSKVLTKTTTTFEVVNAN